MESKMKCRVCEQSEMQGIQENYHYRECGLDNVTIVGITILKCSECGNVMPLIPNIEGLHDTLAQAIIRQNGPLTAAEIVFLRKSLGWSGAHFAKHMHCDKSQVSKWEHGKVEMSKPYDLLLREKVASGKKITDYHSEELVWRRHVKPRPLRLQLQQAEWKEAA